MLINNMIKSARQFTPVIYSVHLQCPNYILKFGLRCYISQFLFSIQVFYLTSTDEAAGLSCSCWRQSARPALERYVSLSRCCGNPKQNSAMTGLLPCQDISHLHSEQTLVGLPSQAAFLKLTCEKS